MFDLVADVEAYPKFLPWTAAARVRSVKERDDGAREMDADLVVSFKVFRERFGSRVVLWDEALRTFLPPSNNPLHVRDIYRNLAEAEPRGNTDLGRLLAEVSERETVAIVIAQSGRTIEMATSFRPILQSMSAPTRTSHPSSMSAPAASACPVHAATTGTDPP